MIKGLRYWDELKRYCNQELSTIEKARKNITTRGFYETCNVTSIYTGMDCRGDIDLSGNPQWMGIDCKPNDFMYCHINWSKYDKMYQPGKKAMDNRYIYSLAKMLEKMGYSTEVIKKPEPKFFKDKLPKNKAVVINIPGHYCCAIAWDYLHGELIYHNPWPGDKRNENKGRFEKIKVSEWGKIPIKYALAFWR